MQRQSVLHPAGHFAYAIGHLWWWMLAVSAIVYVFVLVAFACAALRRGHARSPLTADGTADTSPRDDAAMQRWTIGAVVVTLSVLFAFLIYDFGIGRALAAHPGKALTIDVTGHQWWWEIHYQDPDASKAFTTANEIHVPVGVPVQLRLASDDVIHSFWAPNLNGKRDLVPGYISALWIRADTAGVYRSQCAEFCGEQHAKMALYVVAEPRPRFDAWLDAQRNTPPPPSDSLLAAGQRVFLGGPCATCHTIAGTNAHGAVGPDLTHIASRLSLAAGTLTNTRGNLAGWIVNPQALKPGVRMPPNELRPPDLLALLQYLESLK